MSYDISDYQDVDSTVGSLDSWRSFMAAAKARNLKVSIAGIFLHVLIGDSCSFSLRQGQLNSNFRMSLVELEPVSHQNF
jgi:ABC-type uncharacterized transport system permease subunit